MTSDNNPWFVRWVVGIGAWVTAVILILLGGVFVFSLLDIESGVALSLFGALFFGYGAWLLWNGPSGVFSQQLGIAMAASGAALITGGIAVEAENLVVGLVVAVAITLAVIAITNDPILQFLSTGMAIGFYIAFLFDEKVAYTFDLIALATPFGLGLLLFQTGRKYSPAAVALLMTYPLMSVLTMDGHRFFWFDMERDTIAKIMHILLFLGMVYLHLRKRGDGQANLQVLGFAVAATAVCIIMPAGASAAMLILMLAFVIGSKPFAMLGVLLQTQFILRYYYSLEMDLLNKSFLLMGVGTLLLALWWLLHSAATRRPAQ